jgi:hypothetical protein
MKPDRLRAQRRCALIDHLLRQGIPGRHSVTIVVDSWRGLEGEALPRPS